MGRVIRLPIAGNEHADCRGDFLRLGTRSLIALNQEKGRRRQGWRLLYPVYLLKAGRASAAVLVTL